MKRLPFVAFLVLAVSPALASEPLVTCTENARGNYDERFGKTAEEFGSKLASGKNAVRDWKEFVAWEKSLAKCLDGAYAEIIGGVWERGISEGFTGFVKFYRSSSARADRPLLKAHFESIHEADGTGTVTEETRDRLRDKTAKSCPKEFAEFCGKPAAKKEKPAKKAG